MAPRHLLRFDKNAVMVFDRATGAKLRFAIGSYTKSSKPELADIKITDKCSYGCDFCYQDSGPQGKHATYEDLAYVARELGKVKCAEVALGGGETTEHPQFVEILTLFRDSGIVPNFTTKYPARVRKLWPEIKDLIGAFAYSAESPVQIDAAAKHFIAAGIPPYRVNLHYVMGLQDKPKFLRYLKAADAHGYRVTLLGYKSIGRGANLTPQPYPWLMEALTEAQNAGYCPSVSIDTPLAAVFESELVNAGVDKRMFFTVEGAHSIYVDATSMTFAKSSFENPDTQLVFNKNWRKVYRKSAFAFGGE